MRKINKNYISVVCNGNFIDINDRTIPYRVKIKLPNCIDEWLKSNIKNRYLFNAIKDGKELLLNGKEQTNNNYSNIKYIQSINIEEIDNKGENQIIELEEIPSFYGKSIFNFSYQEIQDFAVAFGLHEIRTRASIEELRKESLLAYLQRIKNISKEEIKKFSFYKYDKTRQKYYFDFSEDDKQMAVINKWECVDLKEFKEQDEEIETGNMSIGEIFSDGKKENENLKNIFQEEDTEEQEELKNVKKI